MATNDIEFWFPAICAFSYYLFVFILAEVARKVIDKYLKPNSTSQVFLLEFIATAQVCTCVYENGIIGQIYGLSPVFLTITMVLFCFGKVNRGASVSPLMPLEMAFNKVIPLKRLFTLLAAEVLGAIVASNLALALWYYSSGYVDAHSKAFESIPQCKLMYKVDFSLVVAFEIVGCALIRIIMPNIPQKVKHIGAPMVVASFIVIAIVFVGVPGLNPVVASSRLFGCQGLDQKSFIAVYWICPVIGWFLGAEIHKSMSSKSPLKLKKKSK